MKLQERDVQRQITDWLAYSQIFFRRANTGAMQNGKRFIRFGKPGDPDIICSYMGKFIAIEVKAEGEKQTDAQKRYQADLENLGEGKYILAYSLEDVKRGLGLG